MITKKQATKVSERHIACTFYGYSGKKHIKTNYSSSPRAGARQGHDRLLWGDYKDAHIAVVYDRFTGELHAIFKLDIGTILPRTLYLRDPDRPSDKDKPAIVLTLLPEPKETNEEEQA